MDRKRREVHALCPYGLYIVDSNEAQNLTEIWLDSVPWLPRPFTEDSPRCEHQDRLLAFRKSLYPGTRVVEGLASAYNMVDPRLQRRRDSEIPHGAGNH